MFGARKCISLCARSSYGATRHLTSITYDITHTLEIFEDDDPTHTRMRLAIGALQKLIKRDGISELEPYLKELVEILTEKAVANAAKNQAEPEKAQIQSP